MNCTECIQKKEWEDWLLVQQFSPFLQSYTMGEVYASLGQAVHRFKVEHNGMIIALCQCITVPARRGRHLVVPYGPVFASALTAEQQAEAWEVLQQSLYALAQQEQVSFIRLSPFFAEGSTIQSVFSATPNSLTAPMHLLSEYVWHIPLTSPNTWLHNGVATQPRAEDEIFMDLRKTTRNLVRRAQKEGVHVEASLDPLADIDMFIHLHEQTRKRHNFTPYSNAFFKAQLEQFTATNQCTLYKAFYNKEVISTSIHMHYGGETSYHHGASTAAHSKIPSSYLLQWHAITDAIARGDHTYSFWGVAPVVQDEQGKWRRTSTKPHPFAGVTTFKTGFGGTLLTISHCRDIVLSPKYYATRTFEFIRKWKRGF
jgi:peptidoglycan pentaglycine glycine transferase (the first glycine)